MEFFKFDGENVECFSVDNDGNIIDITDQNNTYEMGWYWRFCQSKNDPKRFYLAVWDKEKDWDESPILPCWWHGEFYSTSKEEVEIAKDAYNLGIKKGTELCKKKLAKLLD